MFEQSIQYTVRKSRRAKRLRLAVHLDGSVVLTQPMGLNELIVKDFILEKRQWIYDKLNSFQTIDKQANHILLNDDFVKSKDEVLSLVINRVEYFTQKYSCSYNKISIKNQKTRWGSCSKKGNLNFNYKIIFLPEKIRDYIIVHEICHLLESNHSKKFWALVERALPDYKALHKELRSFNVKL